MLGSRYAVGVSLLGEMLIVIGCGLPFGIAAQNVSKEPGHGRRAGSLPFVHDAAQDSLLEV